MNFRSILRSALPLAPLLLLLAPSLVAAQPPSGEEAGSEEAPPTVAAEGPVGEPGAAEEVPAAADGEEAAPEEGDEAAPEEGGDEGEDPGSDEEEIGEPTLLADVVEEAAEEEGEVLFRGEATGEYFVRGNLMSDIPLAPLPRDPTGETADLGQNFWVGQWIRLRLDIGAPVLRVKAELDFFDGVLAGDFAQGVGAAIHPRDDATAFPGVDPRALYVESFNEAGLFRAGLMPSDWGLGILANGGSEEPPFGDYEYGDIVTRVFGATQPLGRDTPLFAAFGGDLVFDDGTADIRDGDVALQGVLAVFWQESEDRNVGVYGVYRSQRGEVEEGPEPFEDALDVFVVDLYAKWDAKDPTGRGRVFAAVEGAYVRGETTETRTMTRSEHDVRQLLVAAQVGRVSDHLDVVLETGWTSGDSNTEDGVQRRATMDPDHKVGLILFPEVMAWQTARAATLAQSEELTGRAPPGSDRIPTNGGVSGAAYLFPYAIWRPADFVDARLGAVWGVATSDVVDPYTQRARSRSQTYRGGDPGNRDLGLELDASVRFHGELTEGVDVSAGLEGGILLPGHAFDDAAGETMDPVALGRLRAGITF